VAAQNRLGPAGAVRAASCVERLGDPTGLIVNACSELGGDARGSGPAMWRLILDIAAICALAWLLARVGLQALLGLSGRPLTIWPLPVERATRTDAR
jgi:hypothetical protein